MKSIITLLAAVLVSASAWAQVNFGAIADGGSITTNGNYRIHTYTTNGTFAVIGGSLTCDVLVVAGGGGGAQGAYVGGGGGGGGLIYTSAYAVATGFYSVVVGAGGANGYSGQNGSNSIFLSLTAFGGGGGSSQHDSPPFSGKDGGSGGGGGAHMTSNHGHGIAGQGHDGGNGHQNGPYPGGGGGGAGEAGDNGVPDPGGHGGDGGDGLAYDISGSNVYYAGGGGGGFYEGGVFGHRNSIGGLGGGGWGSSSNGMDGVPNTGGGGGAGERGGTATGGRGGSGIVIVRYLVSTSGVPAAVTNVAASDGTYPDYVLVTWDGVSGATQYEVWRGATNNLGSAAKITELQTSAGGAMSYSDYDVVDHVTYYYWVLAGNSAGNGPFSAPDSGFILSSVIAPPTGVTASKGAYTNKVSVVWNAVTGATAYEIWRATLNLSPFATKQAETSGTLFSDTNVVNETVYYYWLKSKNASQTSGFSESDSGYALDVSVVQPDIKINGGDSATSLHLGQTLALSITLMTSSGANADWWLIAATPGGWYCYNANTGVWFMFTDIYTLSPSYQGPLFDFMAPVTVFSGNTAWLPTGVYAFYFGVDLNMNGLLDDTGLYYDSVGLTITE